jgi:threonine synthase
MLNIFCYVALNLDLLGKDGKRTVALFKQVETEGGFDLSKDPAFQRISEFGFRSGSSSHQNRLETIRDIDQRYGVMIDTHTADGVKVAREFLKPHSTMLVLETALPIKFGATIQEALGRPADCPTTFEGIERLPQRVVNMPVDVKKIQDFIEEHI